MLSSREKAAQTQRRRADAEIDLCIANETLFGFRKIVAHAPWLGHLRQVVVQCKCGKQETVKYAWLKHKIKLGKMRQCLECGHDGKSGANHPFFSGGGKLGDGAQRAMDKYKRLHPRCERCGASENIHVDHKEPVSRRPDLAKCESNFQSLCIPCHAEKTHADGMGHVVPMLLSTQKSSAVRTECLYCKTPMLTYPTHSAPPKFCSRVCKGMSMRKIPLDRTDELVSSYLAGGISIKTLGERFGVSPSTVLYVLKAKGLEATVISKIGMANRAAAKRTESARDSASRKSTGRSRKLDEDKVRQIKRLLAGGDVPQVQIAKDFDVSAPTIGHIASGLNWSWVTI